MATSSPARKVAVDSGVVIARVTGDRPEHADGIAALFHEIDSGKVELYGSTLLLVEVLDGGFKDPFDQTKENQILAVLDNPNVIRLVQGSRQAAMTARALRREYNLKVADSMHLASAIFAGIDKFMTIDDGFPIGKTVRGVEVCYPDSAYGTPVLGS